MFLQIYAFITEEDTDEDILLQALLAAAQTAEGRDVAYELDMKSWMLTAWGSLYRKFVQLSTECKNAVICERKKLNRMTGYLAEHCNEKLTLAAMGEVAGANGFAGASYFSETFRKEMGCSPADYRKWYRGLEEKCSFLFIMMCGDESI